MSARQAVLFLVLAVGLYGCATQSLSKGDYDRIAHTWASIARCSESGRMDADTAATGQQIIRQRLANSTYDKELMDAALSRFSQNRFYDETCRTTAVTILGWEKQRNQQRQDRQETNEALRSATESIRAATPKQTYCNRIGNQVFCNTY